MSTETSAGHSKDHPVTVNGATTTVAAEELSYEEILSLAFGPNAPVADWVCTVSYRGGTRDRPQGSLEPGLSVKVTDRMVFQVIRTHRK